MEPRTQAVIVPDSSVWIDHFRNVLTPQVRMLRSFEAEDEVVVGDVIALEVLRGARTERQAAIIQAGFAENGIVPMLSGQRAVTAAGHYRRLRTLGITVNKLADLIIATFCIEHGHLLLHHDRDFDHFEQHLGLKVLH
jgi:predicted nucleic acid-binding protein